MGAIFGPAGNSLSFETGGYEGWKDIPRYVKDKGLDCFEYQCGRGVRVRTETAEALGALAREQGVALSLHAPYYISLSGLEEDKRLASVRYIRESCSALKAMGGKRVILHSGSCGKQPREQALELAKNTLKLCLDMMDEEGYGDMTLCPETMGKINQLGSLYEVMELCKVDERCVPCIDFGHLNARTQGKVAAREDFKNILDTIKNELGEQRWRSFHSHFSKIEYTTGGEKRHLTFADTVYGPDYRPLMELVSEYGLSPVFICESDGTQAEDAREMKDYYVSL